MSSNDQNSISRTGLLEANLNDLPEQIQNDIWIRKPDLPDSDEEPDNKYILKHAGVPNADWWKISLDERSKYKVKKQVSKACVGDKTDIRNDQDYSEWCSKRDKSYRTKSEESRVRRPTGRAGPYILWNRQAMIKHEDDVSVILQEETKRIYYRDPNYPIHPRGPEFLNIKLGSERPYNPENPFKKLRGISYPGQPEYEYDHKEYYNFIRYEKYNYFVEKKIQEQENSQPTIPIDMVKGNLNDEEYSLWKTLLLGYKTKNFDKSYVYMNCPFFVKLLQKCWNTREEFEAECKQMADDRRIIPNFSNPDYLLTIKFDIEYWKLEKKRKPTVESNKAYELSIRWTQEQNTRLNR